MRFMYKMAEYDADLFKEYLFAAGAIAPSYHVNPIYVEYKFILHMWDVLGRQNKLAYLTVAPVILHIHVVDVEDDNDSLCSTPIWPYPLKCVRAVIVDTIKGTHIRQGDPVTGYRPPSHGNNHAVQSVSSWVDIEYSPVTPKSYSVGDLVSGGDDSQCDSCYGMNALVPGNDYIVFLEDSFLDYNGIHSFYEYVPYATYNYEGGIFPIDSSGNVLSQDNYFGYGASIPLFTFETLLKADIQSIVSH
jgi:hypothetical protein